MSTLLLLLFPTFVLGGEFYCAEQIQRCAHEELETRVQELKEEAFRSCVKRPACHSEKSAFNECFKSSVRSMRSTFISTNESDSTFFEPTLNEYRRSLDQCFMHSPLVPMRQNFGPRILDEDAVYSRGLLGAELADSLWGLPEIGITRPSLDSMAVCRTPQSPRVFGTGINRLLHSGDPKLNNVSSSCLLEDSELICYRQQLDSNQEYIQAVYQRDYAIRACLQQLRVQTPCRLRDQSRLRSCICNVRSKFDQKLESDILKCVQETSVANKILIKAALHDFETDKVTVDEKKPEVPKVIGMKQPKLTKGEIVNGQCMCACPSSSLTTSSSSTPSTFSQHMTTMATMLKEYGEEEKEHKKEEKNEKTEKKSEKKEDQRGPRFAKDSPRLMTPEEAEKHIYWGDRIL